MEISAHLSQFADFDIFGKWHITLTTEIFAFSDSTEKVTELQTRHLGKISRIHKKTEIFENSYLIEFFTKISEKFTGFISFHVLTLNKLPLKSEMVWCRALLIWHGITHMCTQCTVHNMWFANAAVSYSFVPFLGCSTQEYLSRNVCLRYLRYFTMRVFCV